MGKKVTITTTRQDPTIPWFSEVMHTNATEQAITAEQAFLTDNMNSIKIDQNTTDTTLQVIFEFSDDALFDQYANLIVSTIESPYRTYCQANNMTITKEILDI